VQSGTADAPIAGPHGAPAEAPPSGGIGSILGGLGAFIGGVLGTNRPRGTRLSTGQLVARQVTRSVTTSVAGKVPPIRQSIGGSMAARSAARLSEDPGGDPQTLKMDEPARP